MKTRELALKILESNPDLQKEIQEIFIKGFETGYNQVMDLSYDFKFNIGDEVEESVLELRGAVKERFLYEGTPYYKIVSKEGIGMAEEKLLKLIKKHKGYKVLYSPSYSGFQLSDKVKELYKKLSGKELKEICRHDSYLIQAIEEIGLEESNINKLGRIAIRELPEGCNKYRIDAYDGWESVIIPEEDKYTTII